MKRLLLLLALQSCQPCPAGVVSDTLFAEARGEGRQGILAVASVIWNRAERKGMTPDAVCLAPRQFSCWNAGYRIQTPKNGQERAILAFCEGLEKQMESGTFKPTTKADHYMRFDCYPSWRKELKNQERIGKHIFGNCR